MTKAAKTSIEINHLLANRWSPRAFCEKKISDDLLLKLIEAARWSPSASNLQPWYFIIGKKHDATYRKIFETMVEFNQLWAIHAPILILNCGERTGKDGSENQSFRYDVGQAVAHLTFQAMSDGIYAHQMAGFSKEKAIELLQIPNNFEPLTITALGYIGDPSILPSRMQVSEKAERERKPINEIISQDVFGAPASLINKSK
ncbi:MAG: nitroreductase family protein [Bacteroidetes bacterium]|nr:nitroreductase family protein [Bacteroidota bacterium]